MQAVAQNIPNSIGYDKCGEILKSRGFKDSYILRCIQCKEIYLLFESFIFHLNDACKKTIETKKDFHENTRCSYNEVDVRLECDEETPVKLHVSNDQMKYPLTISKNGPDIDKLIIKKEPDNYYETKNYDNSTHFKKTKHSNKDENVEDSEIFLESQKKCESQETDPEDFEEDPLIVVKNEVDTDESITKIEPENYYETKTYELETSTQFEGTDHSNEDEDIEDIEITLESQTEIEAQETEPEDIEADQNSSKTNRVSSSFVSKFMKSEKNLTLLIAAFKDHPQLWNKSMPYYANRFKRREYMAKIAQDLHNNYNINIKGNQVSAVILRLYSKFQNNLSIAQEKDESKKRPCVKPWYLTQLKFIEPYLEHFSLEIIGPNQPTLLSEQIVKILEIYQNLPHLWNSNLIENHCKNKRHESILEMLEQLETTVNLKIKEHVLEQYLRTIHNSFSIEKRRILNMNKSNKTEKTEKVEQMNNDYYKRLMFLYDHVGPLRCSLCDSELSNPLYFKMHTSTHDGELPFSCSQCNKKFKRVDVYTSHAKRHFQDLNYVCKECGKKFINTTNLRLHMRIHNGDKPYCCEICGESYRYLQSLGAHRRRHEKRYLHTCKICSHGFYSKIRHDEHMNSHLNIRTHTCGVCNKSFFTKKTLKQHKVVHEDARNFTCKLCGKTFKLKNSVTLHMKTHNIATIEDKRNI